MLAIFRAAGAKSAGTTGATAVSAPAGLIPGDLEILLASTEGTGTISVTTAGGTAWTALETTPFNNVTGGEALYIWWRVRAVGDTDPSVTPSADHVCACRLAFQNGTFSRTPSGNRPVVMFQESGTETTSDASFATSATNDAPYANLAIVCVASSGVDSNTAQVPVMANTDLTGLTSLVNIETTSGLGGGFGATMGIQRAKKATALAAFTCTYANASPKVYITFMIQGRDARNSVGDLGNLGVC